MPEIYKRKNYQTKEIRIGAWSEISELDNRVWSEPKEVKAPSPAENREAANSK